ncbi:MAG: ABC transporter ATP-binding protein [Planctomycetota bacterium]
MALLEVRDLQVRFTTQQGVVRAVDGISFDVEAGESLGLVGESGSGKSVSSLAVLGLVPNPPGLVTARSIRFDGQDLTRLSPDALRRLRGNELAMIFQDPMTSLHPLLTVSEQLTEVLGLHAGLRGIAARRVAAAGLGDVGIPEPESRLDAYPHELSGGMRQRVMIAMALLAKPKLLFADEPTTALDVTVQAQILELLTDLRERHGMALVLITHDLGVVAGTTDRVHVMYAGKLVEAAATRALFKTPRHPYTAALLKSVPTLIGDPDVPLPSIEGQPPDLTTLGAGCPFAPRCRRVVERCRLEAPRLELVSATEPGRRGHAAACFEPLLPTAS